MSTLELARQLLDQGRVAEAERACEQVLEHSPNAVEALNVCGVAALRDRNHARAVELLERAVEVAPNDPISQHNLGRAFEAAGRIHDAVDALGRAVRLRPVYHVARLRLAALLDARGERERAVLHYARALEDAQRQGRWLDAAGTPASRQGPSFSSTSKARDSLGPLGGSSPGAGPSHADIHREVAITSSPVRLLGIPHSSGDRRGDQHTLAGRDLVSQLADTRQLLSPTCHTNEPLP